MNKTKKILVTGAVGFIGFHLSKSLLEDNIKVVGIDNINDYYDTSLKNNRLKILKTYPNFSFEKEDIANYDRLSVIFKKHKVNKVVNLAAQAGVRHSIKNPFAYLDSNLAGFLNLLELCRHYKIEGFIYASSSSVYGGNKKIPFSEYDDVNNPISLYAATKKSNELMANAYSHLYGLNTTGLRFFTVYGPWGRPDMALYIFAKKIFSGHEIQVFNHGNMKRDFTYIDDIIHGTKAAIIKNYKCEVFNLGNNKSENLMDVVHLIEKYINKKAKIKYLPMQPGDVYESFSDIDKAKKYLNFNPKININLGIEKFLDWYKEYNQL